MSKIKRPVKTGSAGRYKKPATRVQKPTKQKPTKK